MEHFFSERWDICTSNDVYCSHWYEDFFQGYTVPKNPVKYQFPAIYTFPDLSVTGFWSRSTAFKHFSGFPTAICSRNHGPAHIFMSILWDLLTENDNYLHLQTLFVLMNLTLSNLAVCSFSFYRNSNKKSSHFMIIGQTIFYIQSTVYCGVLSLINAIKH